MVASIPLPAQCSTRRLCSPASTPTPSHPLRSEATIAKRRSYANTISYLTPPAENAGLYKGLKELKELISSYQGMRESGRAEQITATIIETARQCNLDKDVALPEADQAGSLSVDERDAIIGKVYRKLMEIESRLLPCGLHVVGVPPTAEEAIATLVNIAGACGGAAQGKAQSFENAGPAACFAMSCCSRLLSFCMGLTACHAHCRHRPSSRAPLPSPAPPYSSRAGPPRPEA